MSGHFGTKFVGPKVLRVKTVWLPDYYGQSHKWPRHAEEYHGHSGQSYRWRRRWREMPEDLRANSGTEIQDQTVNDGVAHSKNPKKCAYHVTFDLEQTLDARWPGVHHVQVWWRSGHLSARRSDMRKSLQTDRQTRRTDDGRRAIALAHSWNELKIMPSRQPSTAMNMKTDGHLDNMGGSLDKNASRASDIQQTHNSRHLG